MLFKKIRSELDSLRRRVGELETRVEQNKCTHRFVFIRIEELPYFFGKLIYCCDKCGEWRIKYWLTLPKKEQQALKTLNLVPDEWSVTTKGDK